MSFYKLGHKKQSLLTGSDLGYAIDKEVVFVDRPIFTTKEVLKEVVVEKPVVTEVEKIVYVDREVPVEVIKEVQKTVYLDKFVEVKVPTEKVVEIIKEVKVEVNTMPKWAVVSLIIETIVIITLILTK